MSEANTQPGSPVVPLPRPRRKRWVSALLALVIFGAGFIAGAGGAVIAILKRVQHHIQHPEEAPQRITGRLKRRLGLTDEQAARVKAIVSDQQQAIFAIRREAQPRFMAELDRTRSRIDDALDAEQKAKWGRMFDRLRQRWIPPLPPPG